MSLVEQNEEIEWINEGPKKQKLERQQIKEEATLSYITPEGSMSSDLPVSLEVCGTNCLFEAIAERISVPIALVNSTEGKIVYVNDCFRELFGFRGTEPINRNQDCFYYHLTERKKLFDTLQLQGVITNYELVAKKADGTPLWVSVSIETLTVGNELLYFQTFKDISEFKDVENILQSLDNAKAPVTGEQFFPALASYLGSLLGMRYVFIGEVVGTKASVVKVRAFWEGGELTGSEWNAQLCELEYLIAGTPWAKVLQCGSDWIPDNFQSHLSPGNPLGKLEACSYLGVRLVDMNGKPIGLMCGFDDHPLIDVHRAQLVLSIFAGQAAAELDRQRTQRALQQSEGRLLAAFKAAKMGVWEWDLQSGNVTWSDEVHAILGVEKGSYNPTLSSYIKAIQPEDRSLVQSRIVQAIAAKTNYESEYRILHGQPTSIRWIVSKGEVLCDSTGKVVRLIETLTDVTERKQTQTALIESEANLRAIFNSSAQSIVLIDRQYRIKDVNKTARETVKTLWNKTIQPGDFAYKYVSNSGLDLFNQSFHQCLQGTPVQLQQKILGNPGVEYWFEINAQPIFDETNKIIGLCLSAFNITEQKNAVEALAKSEKRFRSLVQNSSDIITILEADGTIRYQSPSVERILGYKPQDLIGDNGFNYIHPEDKAGIYNLFNEALEQRGGVVESEFRFLHASGKWVTLESVGSNLLEEPGIAGFVLNSRDVTERKEQEERLRLFERAIAASSNGIVISEYSKDNAVVYVNPSFEKMTGYSYAEATGRNCRFLQGRDRHQPALQELRNAIHKGQDCKVTLRNYRKDGTLFWNELSLSPVENERGTISHYIGVQTDISDRKRAEEELIHQAYYDPLTGLPNRAFLMERLREASARKNLQDDEQLGVLFIDIDRFKRVNDSLGHAVGDMLLIAIAFRLERCLHSQSTIARLGGDHYVILLENVQNIEQVSEVAEKIHQQLKAPFTFEGHAVFVTVTIGIALSSIEHEVSADLLRNADIAMYRAKRSGKARTAIFDKAMHDEAVQLLQLENDLRRELHEAETLNQTSLRLAYQPIVSLFDGKIVGFEALVRWNHPQRGFIPPSEFIPLAEETGSIVPLGLLVLREACRQLVEWQTRFTSLRQSGVLKMSVNLSGKQFLQPDLVEHVDRVLQETGLDPAFLKLEITESVLIEDTQTANQTLWKLKERNIHLSLDDFGTGYSSLSHLAQFPIDTLKIDKSFVQQIGTEGKNLEIIQAIVTLAHGLGMDVTAEGVETAEQLAELKSLGSEDGQGYFFSKPLSAENATLLLRQSL